MAIVLFAQRECSVLINTPIGGYDISILLGGQSGHVVGWCLCGHNNIIQLSKGNTQGFPRLTKQIT